MHLAPVANLYERIFRGECIKAVVVCPPRHGKTELEMHAVAWLLSRRPWLEFCFAGYSAAFARIKSRRMRSLCQLAGVPIDHRARSVTDWRTGVGQGGMWATSVCGPVTGNGFDIVLIDDPVKGRVEAESGTKREATMEWFRGDVINRLHPGGSCIVTQTRWHPDDPAGKLIAKGWELVKLEAVTDDGETRRALWPERYDLAALDALREEVGEYNWASLYQGSPRPRGGAVFHEVYTFQEAPREARKAIGIDLAYTAKTHADYSVAVVVARHGNSLYVLDVVRKQLAAPDFAEELKRLKSEHPQATMHSYVGGTEKGVIDLLRKQGVVIQTKPAVADKFVRAQPTAADWNVGKILVREGAKWANDFTTEVCHFTGVADSHDDQVDALVAARDALATQSTGLIDLAQYNIPGPRSLLLFKTSYEPTPPQGWAATLASQGRQCRTSDRPARYARPGRPEVCAASTGRRSPRPSGHHVDDVESRGCPLCYRQPRPWTIPIHRVDGGVDAPR